METFPSAPGVAVAAGPERRRVRRRPPRGFAKGALVGLLLVIPLISLAVFAVGAAGVATVSPPVIPVLRLVVVFAGVPAIITAGGVGRLAAEASMAGGRPRAMWVAARAMVFGGAALAVIGAIPTEIIPTSRAGWAILGVAGGIAGAIGGMGIGLACGGPVPSLTELGLWPQEITVSRVVERATRAIRRRRDTGASSDPP